MDEPDSRFRIQFPDPIIFESGFRPRIRIQISGLSIVKFRN